jgi:hypothetical protein
LGTGVKTPCNEETNTTKKVGVRKRNLKIKKKKKKSACARYEVLLRK